MTDKIPNTDDNTNWVKTTFIYIQHFPHGCHHRQLCIACRGWRTIELSTSWHEGYLQSHALYNFLKSTEYVDCTHVNSGSDVPPKPEFYRSLTGGSQRPNKRKMA